MGLDMYAHRRLYVKQWDHQKPEERYSVAIRRGGKPVGGIRTDRISAVEEEVMCWRKANHIHAWFVENVQSGNDDCREHYVDQSDLIALLDACRKVIETSVLVDGLVNVGMVYSREHPKGQVQRTAGKVIKDTAMARELLPTRAGFFFGSTEYGEQYLNDVIATRDWAESMLDDIVEGVPGDIYYSSSW